MKKLLALFLLAVLLIPSPAAYAAAMLSDTGTDDMEQTYTDADVAQINTNNDAAQTYAEAERLLAAGDIAHAAMAFGRITGYKDAWERSFELWQEINPGKTIDTSGLHAVGVLENGRVVATGDNTNGQCNVDEWRNIVSVAAGRLHTVGLRSDGTVIATGFNNSGECIVNDWKNVVAVSAGAQHTLGLRADGSVLATGRQGSGQCDVYDWTDIIAIAGGNAFNSDCSFGLKADGTIIATGDNRHGQCNVSEWVNITAISSGGWHTVGLRADGTVLATEYSEYRYSYNSYRGQCDVLDWTDIVLVSANAFDTFGLRADGTVISTGESRYGECDVSDWHNISSIATGGCEGNTGGSYTIGLKSDGTAVIAGSSYFTPCDVSGWRNLKVPTRALATSSAPSTLSPSSPDGHFNYAILENEPGYLYDRFDDYWTWYAAYDEVYSDADVIIGIQLEGEVDGSDPVGATLYTKIMDKDGRTIDFVQGMIFLIDDVKYSFNKMPGEDGAMAGSVVLYKDGYEIVKAFAEAKEVSVKLKLFSGKSIILDLNKAEFNRTLGNMCKKIVAYNVWDYYLENPGVEMLEMMFPLEITRK